MSAHVGVGCVYLLCFCVSEVDDEGVPLLWPLKPTMGVLCWYMKRGRKGGSRKMKCSVATWRARMCVCVCVCVSMREKERVVT